MMVWDYFTHFHKSALCYTDVHVYRATSPSQRPKDTFYKNVSSTGCTYFVSIEIPHYFNQEIVITVLVFIM